MGSRLITAYSLLALMIAFGLGMAIYYIRKRRERQRILKGGKPRHRHRRR